MSVRHIRVLPVLAAAGLVGLAALVGCGSDSSAPEDETTAPATVEHGSFASCLNEHGVDESAASPVGPPADVDQETWDRAMEACSTLAPGPAGP
ncbi:hypothetical protein [[Mycobacterium] wendilense]|uniref:Uncharacterized protein n=1 Tax=[Mycobacterium] wendilense TaxID=3064284 RepID=A0ABN9NYG4_9MYCO|nr:hypothetical protein [Mycolicibacterium sp. MU0050]CAJ1579688.1 hypothetical protein MU0050_000634 [Mycolicibacterium sp. MU0050]